MVRYTISIIVITPLTGSNPRRVGGLSGELSSRLR